jgi:hypothetical protein
MPGVAVNAASTHVFGSLGRPLHSTDRPGPPQGRTARSFPDRSGRPRSRRVPSAGGATWHRPGPDALDGGHAKAGLVAPATAVSDSGNGSKHGAGVLG